jgi:hypothetical protein
MVERERESTSNKDMEQQYQEATQKLGRSQYKYLHWKRERER